MTESDRKECLQLLIEYAQTKTLILDERQKQLLKQFIEEREVKKCLEKYCTIRE